MSEDYGCQRTTGVRGLRASEELDGHFLEGGMRQARTISSGASIATTSVPSYVQCMMVKFGNIMRVFLLTCALVASVASGSSPGKHKNTMRLAASYDAVWAAVIDVFAARSWDIKDMQKTSGVIATDWISAQGKFFLSCGGSKRAVVEDEQIRFSVRLKKRGSATAVTVKARYRQRQRTGKSEVWVSCKSRGQMESSVHDEVAEAAASYQSAPAP